MSSLVTLKGVSSFTRWGISASSPMEAQMSVYRASAPSTMAGLSLISMTAPLSLAASAQRASTSGAG